MFLDFTLTQIILIILIFIWSGFVRSGLGFGGAALGLPLMLLIEDDPVLWLPIIGIHLLFFSSLTVSQKLHNVDWKYLKKSSYYIIPATIAGVFGLVSLPTLWLNTFIYAISLFYGVTWVLQYTLRSQYAWVDKILLIIGGYIAGNSLTGAPLMVAVYMRNVDKTQLRDTLFTLWFSIVTIKMITFIILKVNLNIPTALALLPIAGIGHIIGLKAHEMIMKNDSLFKRWVGGGLALISILALWRLYFI